MSHFIHVFIAAPEVLRQVAQSLQSTDILKLPQEFALIPDGDWPLGPPPPGLSDAPFRELRGLSTSAAEAAREASAHGPVAYIETNYFGMDAAQAAIVWRDGAVVFGPSRSRRESGEVIPANRPAGRMPGPINEALRSMGVRKTGDADEFDTLGLGKFRTNEDILEEIRATRDPNDLPRILFYRPGDAYGFLSNFSPHPIEVDEKIWPTVEHYFQAQKFPGTEYEEQIRLAPSPAAAAKMGRDRSRPIRSDWEAEKDDVMWRALLAKFGQHTELCEALLKTDPALIIEHTDHDSYWGDGGGGSGQNRLGKLLMEVRDFYR